MAPLCGSCFVTIFSLLLLVMIIDIVVLHVAVFHSKPDLLPNLETCTSEGPPSYALSPFVASVGSHKHSCSVCEDVVHNVPQRNFKMVIPMEVLVCMGRFLVYCSEKFLSGSGVPNVSHKCIYSSALGSSVVNSM